MKLLIMSNGDVEGFDPNLLKAELALLRKRSLFFLLICTKNVDGFTDNGG